MIDLGWREGRDEAPGFIELCERTHHKVKHESGGISQSTITGKKTQERIVTCDQCGYRYHYEVTMLSPPS